MLGLNIDPNNPKGNPAPTELKELGAQRVRYTFYDSSGGNQPDPAKASFYSERAGAYKEAGIDSVVILTYDTYPNRPDPNGPDSLWDEYIGHFANRAAQIAGLLAPYQPAFQVWNEPDHPIHPGYVPTLREAVYGRMQRRVYDAIKGVDPTLTVLTAGLASGNPGWLTRVIQSLGGQLPADAIAFHPYGQRPDRDWPDPNWAFGYFGDLLANYYRAGQNKPVWITEMGVKEEDLNHDRNQVAEFLRRYYRAVSERYSDKVRQLIWFCYSDGMVPPFGLVEESGNRKPAYFAFAEIAEPILETPPAPTIETPPAPTIETPEPSLPTEISDETITLMRQLQSQMAQLQGQLQQTMQQQSQLQSQMQQLQNRLAATTRPVAPSLPESADQPRPPIQDITLELKRDPNQQFPSRSVNEINRVIIHHTAIPATIGTDRIAIHRVEKQGWPGIGYHYFITHDGQIQQTNELTTVATHAGSYNQASVGVCFAGDFTAATPTPAQIDAGARLIAWLLQQLGLPPEAVSGYKELVATQSPGQQWDSGQRWGDQLRQQIQAYLP